MDSIANEITGLTDGRSRELGTPPADAPKTPRPRGASLPVRMKSGLVTNSTELDKEREELDQSRSIITERYGKL